ncbi:hypothetical protein DYB28_013802, partial [Aphanomyces astaci]
MGQSWGALSGSRSQVASDWANQVAPGTPLAGIFLNQGQDSGRVWPQAVFIALSHSPCPRHQLLFRRPGPPLQRQTHPTHFWCRQDRRRPRQPGRPPHRLPALLVFLVPVRRPLSRCALTRSASECSLLSASLDSARAAVQSTLVTARTLLGDGGPGSTLRAVHEFVSAKEAAEKLLARVQADLVVERNSRVAAEAYVAALRDQLDSETRRAAETIGQLRGELAVVSNEVVGWSKRFQTVDATEASLRAFIASLKDQLETQSQQAASLQLDLDRACVERDSARQDASQKSAQLASTARGRDLVQADKARLENEVKRLQDASPVVSSSRPSSAPSPVVESTLRQRIRELEGELAAAHSSADASRTAV